MSPVASSSSHTSVPELAASGSGSSGSSSKAKGKGKAPPAAPKPKVKAGSNWAALKPKVTDPSASKKRKRPAGEGVGNRLSFEAGGDEDEDVEKTFQRGRAVVAKTAGTTVKATEVEGDFSSPLIQELRLMVLGTSAASKTKTEPGKYMAIDCEMVGVGAQGIQSTLGRVSIVNWHGAVLLDTFVKPKERVVDYRTWVSGVSAEDLANAPTFETVIKQVADLVSGKILIGHAIKNDFSALLLSHPQPLTRDTQRCPQLRTLAKTKIPGLKRLTQQVLGLDIQAASHSSVIDARATMALFRYVKDEWEPTFGPAMIRHAQNTRKKTGESKESFPGGGRRGVSSGLGAIVNGKATDRKGGKQQAGDDDNGEGNWWE